MGHFYPFKNDQRRRRETCGSEVVSLQRKLLDAPVFRQPRDLLRLRFQAVRLGVRVSKIGAKDCIV